MIKILLTQIQNLFKKFTFPFYFMDFETIMQGVPLIRTKPYEAVPFQWWFIGGKVLIKKLIKVIFLKFTDQNIEKEFAETLIETLGKKGTIFAHSGDSVEVKILENLKLKNSCKGLIKKIDGIIKRTIDTLTLTRENFYSPLMNGDYGVKSMIKAIPYCPVNYQEENNISGGDEAMLAWFICTNPKTSNEERKKQEKNLIEYCAKRTINIFLFYLFSFISITFDYFFE